LPDWFGCTADKIAGTYLDDRKVVKVMFRIDAREVVDLAYDNALNGKKGSSTSRACENDLVANPFHDESPLWKKILIIRGNLCFVSVLE